MFKITFPDYTTSEILDYLDLMTIIIILGKWKNNYIIIMVYFHLEEKWIIKKIKINLYDTFLYSIYNGLINIRNVEQIDFYCLYRLLSPTN